MSPHTFYQHVCKWIESYHYEQVLQLLSPKNGLRSFIANSAQPPEIKQKLNQQISMKIATLLDQPPKPF